MASPVAPSLNSLTLEACRKVNASPSAFQLFRAREEWMDEVKSDIWTLAKKLKFLQKTTIGITTEGVDRYALPSDFSSDLTMVLLDGLTTGTAQGGAAGTITLAATEGISESALKQKKGILVYEGTGKGSYSQVSAYNSGTKIATVNPNFETAPINGDKYMFVDEITPVYQKPIWDFDRMVQVNGGSTGKPLCFYPKGDVDNGEFILFPKPYRTSNSGTPYGMQLRYYCDLTRLDLGGTLMSTLYRRWRNIFIKGVYWKALEDENDRKNDQKTDTAERAYRQALTMLITRETYGVDLSNLQASIME